MPRIKQKALSGSTKAKPELATARQTFKEHLVADATKNKTLLKTWLQHPDTGEAGTRADGNCVNRAKGLSQILGGSATVYDPSVDTKIDPFAAKWGKIDKLLEQKKVVPITGQATFVGGEKSTFTQKNSHHVVILVAKGHDSEGDFYVVFDPDINATEASQEAWTDALAGRKLANLSVPDQEALISTMLFDETGAGFGPLFRKYYIETKEPFPKTERFG
jgi:hypothetical protein